MKKVFLFLIFAELILVTKTSAQSLGINNSGAAADASSILDVSSTSKGLLIPRMTQMQRNAINSPATGLMIYQMDNTPGFYYYNGSAWVQAIGPQGPQGATGATGPAGPTGASGATGAAGADGKTVLNGTSAPTSGTGVDGDFYINTSTNTLYGPKASGTWPSGVSLVGPQGVTGATGSTGATGPAGPAPSGTGIVTVNGGVLGTPANLTGDVTSSGLTTTIENNAITSGKILDGTITGTDIANSTIDLTSKVTGTLPVANGGTGQTTYTDGQLLIGNTTGNTLTKSTLTAGSGISITNGAGTISIATTGAAPTGSAGGDLTGTYPNPTVSKINGATLGTTTATSGNLLIANGTQWGSTAMSGDATIASSGILTLKNTGTAGTYGSATQVPVLTTDAQGRITGVTNTTITGVAPSAGSTNYIQNGTSQQASSNFNISGSGTLSTATLTGSSGTNVLNFENGANYTGKNSSGTSEFFLTPRGTDNVTYLNYGSAGFNIRNNSSTTAMFINNAGQVIIGSGEGATPSGNTLRAPNASTTNAAGGALTLNGGWANGSGAGGSVFINGGTTGTGTNGNVYVRGGNSNGGFGAVFLNDQGGGTFIGKSDNTMTTTLYGTINLPALSASSAVYTDGSKNLTTTAPSTGNLGFWTRSGTSLYNTTLTDRVGIGTTSPTQLLTMGSSTNNTTIRLSQRTPNSGGTTIFNVLGNDPASGPYLSWSNTLPLRFSSATDDGGGGWTERMRIDGSTGNVTVAGLAGNGLKNVVADANGVLRTISSTFGTTVVTNPTSPWTVPAGVYQIRVFLVGGGGGGGWTTGAHGGTGGMVSGILNVSPGESLTIVRGAGGAAATGSGLGGAGGTGSSISRGATMLAAAGGGAGGSGNATKTVGKGGGMTFGTSINGSAGGITTTSQSGGNNYIGYLSLGSSFQGSYGSGNNTATSTAVPSLIAFDSFYGDYGVNFHGYAGGSTSTTLYNGSAGVVVIAY